jgi:hypothetical protein
MISNKNIPDADQYWPSAEKALDRHFRRKRLLVIFLSLAIPAVVGGIFWLLHEPRATSSQSSDLIVQELNLTENPALSNAGRESTTEMTSSASSATASSSEIAVTSSSTREARTSLSASNQNLPQEAGIQPAVTVNNHSESIIAFDTKEQEAPSTMETVVASPVLSGQSVFSEAAFKPLALMSPVRTNLVVHNSQSLYRDPSIHPIGKPAKQQVGFDVAFYAGIIHVNKLLSFDGEGKAGLQHRESEEDPVTLPVVGIAFAASKQSFGLSIGAEFSILGEKTNYYPYSLKPDFVDNSFWQYYQVSYIDVDTAYIMGNAYYMDNIRMRDDSSYIAQVDTVEVSRYDEEIARNNGINRLYYIEMPVEVSYVVSQGKAGLGFSGGIAPAMLIHKKGHYIRSDGRGIESFEEMTFRKFLLNARVSADFYYRIGGRTKIVLRPQVRTNLSSVLGRDSGVSQRYYSTGLLFGVTYMLD